MQAEALKMGIPLRTRHREVAPNQYEMAPLFGSATTQVDQNLWVRGARPPRRRRHRRRRRRARRAAAPGLARAAAPRPASAPARPCSALLLAPAARLTARRVVRARAHAPQAMQIIEEVASNHGLTALLQEKPFNDVNGSGKHNNWSIGTACGTNLLNVKQVRDKSGSAEIFPVIMAAIISAVDKHGDLMRAAIASPGNDFRLGACEAPPAIVSTYLGDDMTKYLEAIKDGKGISEYVPNLKNLDLGVSCVGPLEVPAEDRNRTSPFPYGGHRFEFRAVGSSQNVSLVNTVLQTVCAEAFKEFADAIEGGKKPSEVASAALKQHWKVLFNGNSYDEANQEMLTQRGVWRIDSGVEATNHLGSDKNKALFKKMGVLSEIELEARRVVHLEHYIGTVEIEAGCLVDMINQHVLPACQAAGVRAARADRRADPRADRRPPTAA